MKTIYIALIMLIGTIFGLSAQTKSNFTIHLQGFDQFDQAVVTIQRLDELPDVLVEETELTNGHSTTIEKGSGRVVLDHVPEHFILSLNFYLKKSKYRFITNWYVNRTDRIVIKDNHSKSNFDKVTFSGRGADLYSLQYKLDGLIWNRTDYLHYPKSLAYFNSAYGHSFDYEKAVDNNIEVGKLVNGSAIESAAKQWIQMNMFYKIFYNKFIRSLYNAFNKHDPQHYLKVEELLDIFNSHYHNAMDGNQVSLSTSFIKFYLYYLGLKGKCHPENNYVDQSLKQLKHDFKSEALEKMGYAFLAESFNFFNTDDREKVVKWMLSISKSPERLTKLKGMTNIAAGRPFPDFELTDLNGKVWHKKDLLGKVVFFDFYYTGCSNCAKFYQHTVSKAEEHYRNNPAVVFVSISIDKSLELWRKSVASKEYNSAESLKLYTNGMGEYHPLIKALRVTAYPFPLLMGKTGLIETSDRLELGYGVLKKDGLINTIDRTLAR
ncbi:MAG: SCO family protein [Sphingobacterium sp.]|jgi:thiol-disulfide isomerase/thioredoxin|nr:SCO family protein [Sphingobacterium sp.]